MRNEIELEAIIEDYLKGKLTAAEKAAFEQLRSQDPLVDHKVVAHKVFLDSMAQYAHVVKLKEQMDAAHAQLDVAAMADEFKPHPSRMVRIWRNNKSAFAVAASFLILAMIMLHSIHNQNRQVGDIQLLAGKVSDIKGSQDIIVRTINNDNRRKDIDASLAKFGGTGFAISSNGYILTSYHVINGKGSIYVQNSKGVTYKVVRYYTDPINDIAVLKISDTAFVNLGTLPYSIKKGAARIGDAVYTLGYPKDDVVLGDGYVSSKTGLNGDTVAYQVAIPVNPGNSGGPLLDNSGNIVGVINGKENKTEGAAFAIKSKYIMEALNAIPQDSLSKRVTYGKRSLLQGLKRNQQVQKMQDYVFNIKVY